MLTTREVESVGQICVDVHVCACKTRNCYTTVIATLSSKSVEQAARKRQSWAGGALWAQAKEVVCRRNISLSLSLSLDLHSSF